jgi:ribosomal protein L7/L12
MGDMYWTLGVIAVVVLVSIGGYLFTPRSPKPLTDEHIRQAVREGDKVKAIRWHRELHGTGLEASAFAVEQMAKEQVS